MNIQKPENVIQEKIKINENLSSGWNDYYECYRKRERSVIKCLLGNVYFHSIINY